MLEGRKVRCSGCIRWGCSETWYSLVVSAVEVDETVRGLCERWMGLGGADFTLCIREAVRNLHRVPPQ